MGKIIKFEIKMDIIDFIDQRIKEYESTGMSYTQDYDNEEEADKNFAKAEALKELRDEIINRIEISKLLGELHIQ